MSLDVRPLADLAPNPHNPRKITGAKAAMLKKALERFGDLGGIVYNERSRQLVGGHQRAAALPGSSVVIERRFDAPTPTGTVAEGYVHTPAGDRFAYRVVSWPPDVEKAANLAANKGAGTFDIAMVSEWMLELDTGAFQMDLTMFDAAERDALVVGDLGTSTDDAEPSDAGKTVECPSCGYEFRKSGNGKEMGITDA